MKELKRFMLKKNVSEIEKSMHNLKDFLVIVNSPIIINNYNDKKSSLCYIDCDGSRHSDEEIGNYYEEFDVDGKFTIIENNDATNINRLLLALRKNIMLGGNGYDNYIRIQLLTDSPKSAWQPIADMAFEMGFIEYQDGNTKTCAKISVHGVRYLENNNLID